MNSYHLTSRTWKEGAAVWNGRLGRKNCRRGARSADPRKVPAVALRWLIPLAPWGGRQRGTPGRVPASAVWRRSRRDL